MWSINFEIAVLIMDDETGSRPFKTVQLALPRKKAVDFFINSGHVGSGLCDEQSGEKRSNRPDCKIYEVNLFWYCSCFYCMTQKSCRFF